MACNLDTVLSAACTSHIGMVNDPILLLQIIAQLSCEVSSAAASSGGVTAGVGAPSSTPTTDAAIYFDTATGVQYNWFSNSWH